MNAQYNGIHNREWWKCAEDVRAFQTIYHVSVPVGQPTVSFYCYFVYPSHQNGPMMMVVSKFSLSFLFVFVSLCDVVNNDELKLKLIQPLWALCEHALRDDHQCHHCSGQRTFCFAIKFSSIFILTLSNVYLLSRHRYRRWFFFFLSL